MYTGINGWHIGSSQGIDLFSGCWKVNAGVLEKVLNTLDRSLEEYDAITFIEIE